MRFLAIRRTSIQGRHNRRFFGSDMITAGGLQLDHFALEPPPIALDDLMRRALELQKSQTVRYIL
jgi:hypothetical protein